MSFSEAMREIESHAFTARLGLASDFNSLLRAMKLEPSVKVMSDELESRDKQEQVLSRIINLSRHRTDIRYENPWDNALTVYLWLLSAKQPSFARIAAQAIADAPQCWWAKELAGRVVSNAHIRTSSATTMNYAHTVGLVFEKKYLDPMSVSAELLFRSTFLGQHADIMNVNLLLGDTTTTESSNGKIRWQDDDRPTMNFDSLQKVA